MSQYGPIVTAKTVRAAYEATLRKWSHAYIAEVARQAGYDGDYLPPFDGYESYTTLDHLAGHGLPACIIASPGWPERPRKSGDGNVDAVWRVHVGALVTGPDEGATFELAELYAAALRTLFYQRTSLDGFASGLDVVSERYDELLDTTEDRITLMAGTVLTDVRVAKITDTNMGPLEPPEDAADDPGEWSTVNPDRIFITVEEDQ